MEEDLITDFIFIAFCLGLGVALLSSDFLYLMIDNVYSYVYGR